MYVEVEFSNIVITLLMTFLDFCSRHPSHRKYPFYYFRSSISPLLDEIKAHFRCEGVGWVRHYLSTKRRFRRSRFRTKPNWCDTYHPSPEISVTVLFSVLHKSRAYLTNCEAAEHRGPYNRLMATCMPDPEMTGSCAGIDLFGAKVVKKRLF